MNPIELDTKFQIIQNKLRIDCNNCSGLCCVALYCAKTDGFPENKNAGIPCKYLNSDFQCEIHSKLIDMNMRGCLAYDCFGAGQKVTQDLFPNTTWKSDQEKSKIIFEVFLRVFQLHQMEWYLLESLTLVKDKNLSDNIEQLILKIEHVLEQSYENVLDFEITSFRLEVNPILKLISRQYAKTNQLNGKDMIGKNFKMTNLDGKDFSMSLLIAANFEGCSLNYTNFLGADLRDTNFKNTDLSSCLYLTQIQINSSVGNKNTILPKNLIHPISWD